MSIFISYSHEDAEFVDRLSLALIGENIKVWKDTWKLTPGAEFSSALNDAITTCRHFCIVISAHTLTSDWVRDELEAALERAAADPAFRIFPLRVDDTEMPPALSSRLELDFQQDFDAPFKRLVTTVGADYNLPDAGAPDDGSPYFFFHAIEGGESKGRFYMRLDTVSFDMEERSCVVGEVVVIGNEQVTAAHFGVEKDEDLVDVVLRSCAIHFKQDPRRINITRRRAEVVNFSIGDDDGATFFIRVRLQWMPSGTAQSLVFNFSALIVQVCRAEGIEL
ncbi:MAG: toll/interleukin-1 receptor domain-containing protein [Verrucomicrobiota bacterium]